MFNQPLHYTQLKCEDYTTFSDKTYPDYRTIFKTATAEKKPYLIYLEQFSNDYFFIKFFPSRHRSNPEKYKLRTGQNKKILPVKLLTTCLTIVVNKMKIHQDSCFGVYGQWDQKDVYEEVEESQRYRMWLTIAARKIDSDKFRFLYDSSFNFFLVVPNHIYSEEFKKRTQKYFEKRFKSKLNELPIPTVKEFEAFKMK